MNRAILVIIYSVAMITVNSILAQFKNALLNICVWQVTFFAIAFLYESKVYEKMISAVVFNIMGVASELIVVSIFSFIGENQKIDEYNYVEVMFSKLIVFMLIIIISLVYKKKNCLYEKKYRYIFIISLLISIIELVVISYIMFAATGKYIPQMGVVAFAIVVVNFILYMFVDGYSEMYEHKEREQLLEKSLNIQEASFEQLSNNYIQMRRILHDANKHMKIIAGMVEEQENKKALDYIDETLGEINATYKKVNTGNIVIDAMLSNLINQCNNCNIECSTETVVDSNSLTIDNRDLTIILGNLTENALNYSKSVVNMGAKIDMAVIMNGDKLIIDIKNTCYDENAGMKKDCGIENIEKVVNKYSGTYNIKCENGIYNSSIILPFST